MYKVRLQELCQRRRWKLPRYSTTKNGPPHNPSFKASAFVNGVTFTSTDTFNSSKEAHNHAAMKAFFHFSSPVKELRSSLPTYKYGPKGKIAAAKPPKIPVPPKSRFILTDTDRSSKLQQQNYTQKNDVDPPVFTIKAEGPPHDIHYKANVVIDEKSLEIPTFFNTEKEAEEAAAKFVDMFKQDESFPSKTLLLELTQREGFSTPTYKTTQNGCPHMPTFFSTVEVEGVELHGKASKSKKQAEHDAAKIAYIAIKECGLHMYAAEQSTPESDIVKSKQKLNPEDEILVDKEILPTDIKVNNDIHNESFPLSPNKKMKMSNICSSSSPTELLCAKISETNKAMTMTSNTSNSYLLCDRFKVYTSYPDIVFPKGITVLPIAEDKWVAVSLEFPNEKD